MGVGLATLVLENGQKPCGFVDSGSASDVDINVNDDIHHVRRVTDGQTDVSQHNDASSSQETE